MEMPLTFADLTLISWRETLALLGIAVVAGFIGGIWYARLCIPRPNSLQEATCSPDRLIHQLKLASQECEQFRKQKSIPLSSEQIHQLDAHQKNLVLGLTELSQRVVRSDRRLVRQFVKTPTDASTGLPGFLAFKENLDVLLGMQERSQQLGGVLLIRIDKESQLTHRFGPVMVSRLKTSLIELIQSEFTKQETLCAWDRETLAAVIAPRNVTEMIHLSDSLRHRIRTAHFELPETSTEVLLTASFGLAIGQFTDSEERLFGRARAALRQAENQGRNQLAVCELDSLRIIAPENLTAEDSLLTPRS